MSRNYYSEINLHLTWHCKVKQYIRNQREHHAFGKVHDRLERITELES